ncbi:hypothetical protein [Clostridium arbusti]|nr:hypothetical protein [Clostridium arbusti]
MIDCQWKKGLKSQNILVRYKSRQFIGILKNAEPIQSFDMDFAYSAIIF